MQITPPFNIVLVEPEIPPNTGSIARLCGATDSVLHLVKPLGFSTDDKQLKRAGLDYWQHVSIVYWESLEEFLASASLDKLHFFSKKVRTPYTAGELIPVTTWFSARKPKDFPLSLSTLCPTNA